jgi:hypothetical protein
MIITFGYIGFKGSYYDLSNSLKGAKISSTYRGIKEVYKRVGYNTFLVSEKINNKWVNKK